MRLLSLVFCVVLLWAAVAHAQVKSSNIGTVSGQVKDSVDMTNLTEATATIYLNSGTSVLSYQLTNSFGRFKFSELPVGKEMTLVITYMGYGSIKRSFVLSMDAPDTVFKNLITSKSAIALEEVKIYQSPMFMRGDTLVFTVAAFESKPNAVIGDLVKNLPGIIIWGDGKVTVNGKPVSQVLVGGKVFFSGDPAISLGNIPTEAVKTVQIIPDNFGVQSSLDTALRSVTMNIELYPDRKNGSFSKIGYGQGTDGKFEGTVTYAAYSDRAQFSLGADVNNINKQSGSIGNLLALSTFKTGGISKEINASDFGLSGLHTNRFGGASYLREWSDRIKSKTEFNMTDERSLFRESEYKTSLLNDQYLVANSQNSSQANIRRYEIANSMEYGDSVYNRVNFNSRFSRSWSQQQSTDQWLLKDEEGIQINNSETSRNNHTKFESGNLGVTYSHRGRSSNSKEDFKFEYRLEVERNRSDRDNEAFITSRTTDTEYQRNYQELEAVRRHFAQFEWYNLDRFARMPLKVDMTIVGDLRHADTDADVLDFGSLNHYLSNLNVNRRFELRPRLDISKFFVRADHGRNVNTISFNSRLEYRYLNHNNSSDKQNRIFEKKYSVFTPAFAVQFTKKRTNRYRHSASIGFSSDFNIPRLEQLAPLVDSTDLSQYYFGNYRLRPEYTAEYTVGYRFAQDRPNGLKLELNFKIPVVRNYITDSIFYDQQGIRNLTQVNAKSRTARSLSVNLNKNFKFNKRSITWELNAEATKSKTPVFINQLADTSHTRLLRGSTNIVLRYTPSLTFRLLTRADFYENELSGSAEFSSMNVSGETQVIYNWERLTLATSFDLNTNKTGAIQSTFLIWNAFVSYRFSKGEQFELKLTGNDLLDKNKGVRNFVSNSEISIRTFNRIRQYAMLSLAYYPRYFGKAKKQN